MVKEKPTVRSLLAPLRMDDGMDEKVAPKKKPEPVDGPLLTERDKMKLERRKRKDDRQREVIGSEDPLSAYFNIGIYSYILLRMLYVHLFIYALDNLHNQLVS